MAMIISPGEARALVLHSQRLPPQAATDTATTTEAAATLRAIEHLGYIQIDTISVVERAHHHVLWSRNPQYRAIHLEQLLEQKQVFEYWSHAAAYLPMADYRFSLPRKLAIASGEREHWYARDPALMRHVLERIRVDGPLRVKDFEHHGKPIPEWQSKPAKRALEYLFMQGDLMVPRRQAFHKVYDLTERVLPADTNTSPPTSAEYAHFLIRRYLQAHGLAQASDFGYLLKGIKPAIQHALKNMLKSGEMQEITPDWLTDTQTKRWYVLPESLALLGQPLRPHLLILSPFDNLLIQRERLRKLFGFDYQIECYLPEAKRRYGYFSLPILWDGRLVARIDCKAERKSKILTVNHLALEAAIGDEEAFRAALAAAMPAFLAFNACQAVAHSQKPTC